MLPCLDSSTQCLATLTELAIQNSLEIEAIDQQLALAAERQRYTASRRWTNYLTLDPVRLVQNVLGGGDVQRDGLAIAALELESADLLRRREAVAEEIAEEIVDSVLRYEKLEREIALLASQLETSRQRIGVMEAAYRTGQGSTTSMLSAWQRAEDLEARQQEKVLLKEQIRRELEIIMGVERAVESNLSGLLEFE